MVYCLILNFLSIFRGVLIKIENNGKRTVQICFGEKM